MNKELVTVLKSADLSIYKADLDENEAYSGGMFESVPMIKTVGKEFILSIGGEPVLDPSKELFGVLLKANKHKSNRLYLGQYNPKEVKAPDCASVDDVKPDSTIEEPQSDLCANCKYHTMGGLCRQHRRVVVCFPDQKNDTYSLFRLDVPSKTLAPLAAYIKLLDSQKIACSGVLTKITMDASETYAKFDFSFAGLLPVQVYQKIITVAKQDPLIQAMLSSTALVDTPNGESKIKKEVMPTEIKKTDKINPKSASVKSPILESVDFGAELDEMTKDL